MNVKLLVLLFGIGAVLNQVSCEEDYKNPDYADDDAGGDEDDDIGPPARIITKGGRITATKGSTISLPCEVENSENAAIQWRKFPGDVPLFFDNIRQTKDPRFSMDTQFTLHIKDIKEEDVGNYMCVIIGSASSVEHKVEISSAPKILRLIPEGSVKVIKKGNPLTLMCDATGEPKPTIHWTHKKKHSHKVEPLEGISITYNQVSRQTSGEYTCIAESEKGRDQKTIAIDVEYEPEIETPKELVNSAEGYESELACTVHAHPSAKVTWLKEDKTVKESHHISHTKQENMHILRISNTKNSDFGTYKCIARNELGSSNKTIILSGLPSKPIFLSANVAEDGKSPVLTWRVSSYSPITSFELMYKKQQEDKWDTAQPTVIPDGENAYMAKHTLKNLDAGTYVAQIKAKNMYGWSSLSEQKPFSGDVIGDGAAMQSKYLESSMSKACNLEMRISVVFVMALVVAHFFS